MPRTSGIAAALTLSKRAQAAAAAIVPIVPVPCQRPPPLWFGLARLSRQQRRDDRRNELALRVGEVEIERVGGNAVGQCGELRRGAQRMADNRGRGLGALRLHHLAYDRGRL